MNEYGAEAPDLEISAKLRLGSLLKYHDAEHSFLLRDLPGRLKTSIETNKLRVLSANISCKAACCRKIQNHVSSPGGSCLPTLPFGALIISYFTRLISVTIHYMSVHYTGTPQNSFTYDYLTMRNKLPVQTADFSNISGKERTMKRTIDVSTNLSTQVAPDTIDVDITAKELPKSAKTAQPT